MLEFFSYISLCDVGSGLLGMEKALLEGLGILVVSCGVVTDVCGVVFGFASSFCFA